MRLKKAFDQRGDTIVEVLLASAVLSLVLAGVFTLSNRATRLNQTAYERTVVSNLMQREVELIKASSLQDGTTKFWENFSGTSSRLVGSENTNFCDKITGSNSISQAFYMTDPVPPPTPADAPIPIKTEPIVIDTITQAMTDATADIFDIWVEAVGASSDPQVDFFVYACWEGIGGEAMQSSGLVLRLARP